MVPARLRRRGAPPRQAPLERRDWLVADLHLHTSRSHDCSIEVDDLLDHAEAEGLGAIAVTDHNVFGGALEAVERARERRLIVIPGEEVKTAGQGEVIGLFIEDKIPPGMTPAIRYRANSTTRTWMRPSSRLHTWPDSSPAP